ncbi:hypothetical protein FRB90_003990, partial [Tulasnella sp. 427]
VIRLKPLCFQYCSRECQVAHWKLHKSTCSSPYAAKDWAPTYEKQGRPAAFMTGQSEPTFAHYGKAGNYLWGNIVARDALNISMNEGESVKKQDVRLCFAASGDLRNVIKTLNGLSLDYGGQCTLVINDFHPQVAIRNVVLLCMLLDSSGPSAELTAEAVLHVLYSASLTLSQSELVGKWMERASVFVREGASLFHGGLKLGPTASLEWWYPQQVADLLRRIRDSTYTRVQSEADRRRNMISPERIDYRERYYSTLRPRHRVGYAHWLDTGILLPLGQPVGAFDKPNRRITNTFDRLLYSEDAEWLLMDSANPCLAWDPLEVEATRKKRGLPDEDYFGSLFFHIKQELVEFITRARRFNLSVLLFSVDLNVLPQLLDLVTEGKPKLMFDRVETSNVMDTTGPSSIISSWGPRLNRTNPHSALLMYSMNFALKVKDGAAENQPPNKMTNMVMQLTNYLGYKRGMAPPPMQLVLTSMAAFFDTRAPFAEYLRQEGVSEACRTAKVRQRKVPRILPVRVGVGLKDYNSPNITITPEEFYFIGNLLYPTWHERFVEFELA